MCYWNKESGECMPFTSCLDIHTKNKEDCLRFQCQYYPFCERCKYPVESCAHQNTEEDCKTHLLFKGKQVDTVCYWHDGFCQELRQLTKCKNILEDSFQCEVNYCRWTNNMCMNNTCESVFQNDKQCTFVFNQGSITLCMDLNNDCQQFNSTMATYTYEQCRRTNNVFHWDQPTQQCLPCQQDYSPLLFALLLPLLLL